MDIAFEDHLSFLTAFEGYGYMVLTNPVCNVEVFLSLGHVSYKFQIVSDEVVHFYEICDGTGLWKL